MLPLEPQKAQLEQTKFPVLSKFPNSLCFDKISKFPVFSLSGIFFCHFPVFPVPWVPCCRWVTGNTLEVPWVGGTAGGVGTDNGSVVTGSDWCTYWGGPEMRDDLSDVQTPDPRRPYGTCRHMGSIPLLPQYVVGVPTQSPPPKFPLLAPICPQIDNFSDFRMFHLQHWLGRQILFFRKILGLRPPDPRRPSGTCRHVCSTPLLP